MIVLEGPDGSGKTTLLEMLEGKFQLPKHPRFVGSTNRHEITHAELARKAFQDVQTMPNQTLSIYDRHPFLSEYAYAAAIPERTIPLEFLEGWAVSTLRQFARHSLIVLCLPPFSNVLQNVTGCQLCDHPDHTGKSCTRVKGELDDGNLEFCTCDEMSPPTHMAGVADNIGPIYQMYQLLHVFWPNKDQIILYDYTDRNSLMRVLSRIQLHIANWKPL